MAIAATTAAATQNAAVKSATTKFAEDFDSFLTLLTTQLKNQDPTKPMDPSEFTSQLVQFTGVEQQINTNAKLADLLAAQQATQTLSAAGYLGTTVEASGSSVPLVGGQAQFTYTLAGNAETSTINILDASGTLVRRAEGNNTAGKHVFEWDGKDNAGNTLPNGTYTVSVTARTGEQSIATTTGVLGVVTGIGTQNGNVTLSLSGVPVGLSQLIEVKKTASAAP